MKAFECTSQWQLLWSDSCDPRKTETSYFIIFALKLLNISPVTRWVKGYNFHIACVASRVWFGERKITDVLSMFKSNSCYIIIYDVFVVWKKKVLHANFFASSQKPTLCFYHWHKTICRWRSRTAYRWLETMISNIYNDTVDISPLLSSFLFIEPFVKSHYIYERQWRLYFATKS